MMYAMVYAMVYAIPDRRTPKKGCSTIELSESNKGTPRRVFRMGKHADRRAVRALRYALRNRDSFVPSAITGLSAASRLRQACQTRTCDGETVLHVIASRHGDSRLKTAMVVAIELGGVSPNVADSKSMTPLHHVSSSAQATKALVDRGADLSARDRSGRDPLETLVGRASRWDSVRETIATRRVLHAMLSGHGDARCKAACLASIVMNELLAVWMIRTYGVNPFSFERLPATYHLRHAQSEWILSKVVDDGWICCVLAALAALPMDLSAAVLKMVLGDDWKTSRGDEMTRRAVA